MYKTLDNNAKINVPAIKPSCIADVTMPVSSIPTFIADCKSPIIALPANQIEVTANCENTITGSIRLGISINLYLKLPGIEGVLIITYEEIHYRLK